MVLNIVNPAKRLDCPPTFSSNLEPNERPPIVFDDLCDDTRRKNFAILDKWGQKTHQKIKRIMDEVTCVFVRCCMPVIRMSQSSPHHKAAARAGVVAAVAAVVAAAAASA